MKTIKKYTNIACLLIIATTIIPLHGNLEKNNTPEPIKQEKITAQSTTETAWYHKFINEETMDSAFFVLAMASMIVYLSIPFINRRYGISLPFINEGRPLGKAQTNSKIPNSKAIK